MKQFSYSICLSFPWIAELTVRDRGLKKNLMVQRCWKKVTINCGNDSVFVWKLPIFFLILHYTLHFVMCEKYKFYLVDWFEINQEFVLNTNKQPHFPFKNKRVMRIWRNRLVWEYNRRKATSSQNLQFLCGSKRDEGTYTYTLHTHTKKGYSRYVTCSSFAWVAERKSLRFSLLLFRIEHLLRCFRSENLL